MAVTGRQDKQSLNLDRQNVEIKMDDTTTELATAQQLGLALENLIGAWNAAHDAAKKDPESDIAFTAAGKYNSVLCDTLAGVLTELQKMADKREMPQVQFVRKH